MLPAAARLRSGRDIGAVMRSGARGWGGDGVSVRVHLDAKEPDPSGGPVAQVAFAVGKPVGSAVARNRLRRRLRALTRARLAGLPPQAQLVVGADARAAALDLAQLARALDRALAAALRRAAGTTSADGSAAGTDRLGSGVAP
jgi:ribonuclease P protein component